MNYIFSLCISVIKLFDYHDNICDLQQIIIVPNENIKFFDNEINIIYNYIKSLNNKLIIIYENEYLIIKHINNEIRIYKYYNYYKIFFNFGDYYDDFDVSFISDIYDCINIFNILIYKNLK